MTRLLLFTLVASSSAVTASAQGLGAIAKQAEEQRKALEGQPKIEIVGVPVRSLPSAPLDRAEIERYASLRIAIGYMWNRDEALYTRMRNANFSAATIAESIRVLDSEPEIVELFAQYNYTSEGFLATTYSMKRAMEGWKQRADPHGMSSIDAANLELFNRDASWISYTLAKVQNAETFRYIWR